jgi:heterodisulfide reductase subunit C
MRRQIKYQVDTQADWGASICRQPGCERVFSCIQCGTCSGTCPVSIYMDISPRRIMALVREGFRDEALASKTIWLCSSCYSCAVACPQKISVTDVMYSLKREATSRNMLPKDLAIPILAEEFCKMVARRGRNSEFWLVLRMAMRTNPFALLTMTRLAWNLWRTGRLPMGRDTIVRRWELPGKASQAEARS